MQIPAAPRVRHGREEMQTSYHTHCLYVIRTNTNSRTHRNMNEHEHTPTCISWIRRSASAFQLPSLSSMPNNCWCREKPLLEQERRREENEITCRCAWQNAHCNANACVVCSVCVFSVYSLADAAQLRFANRNLRFRRIFGVPLLAEGAVKLLVRVGGPVWTELAASCHAWGTPVD